MDIDIVKIDMTIDRIAMWIPCFHKLSTIAGLRCVQRFCINPFKIMPSLLNMGRYLRKWVKFSNCKFMFMSTGFWSFACLSFVFRITMFALYRVSSLSYIFLYSYFFLFFGGNFLYFLYSDTFENFHIIYIMKLRLSMSILHCMYK